MGGGEARALTEKDQLEQGQEVVSSGSQASISTRGWSKPEDQKVGTGLRSCQESGLNSEDDGAAAGLEECLPVDTVPPGPQERKPLGMALLSPPPAVRRCCIEGC